MKTVFFSFSRTLLCVLLLDFTSLIGQDPHPSFKSYNVNDGLPSSEVYQVKQDSKGYIWFATSNGVSRFNGYEFENFSMDKGLPDNTVFEIQEDVQGNIWFLPISNKLSYYSYTDGKIHLYKYNQLLQEKIKKTQIKTSFLVDGKGTVFLGLRFFGIYEISASGKLKVYPENKSQNTSILICEPEENKLSFGGIGSVGENNYRGDSIVTFQTRTLSMKVSLPEKSLGRHPNPLVVMLKNRDIILALSSGLYLFDEQGRYKRYHFDHRIVWVYEDKTGDLWIGTYRGGVYHVKNRDFEHKACYLGGNFVTGVLEDRDGGFWFTTSNKAVFYSPSKTVLTCDENSTLGGTVINSLVSDGKKLYVTVDNTFIRKLDSSGASISLNIGSIGREGAEIRDLHYDTARSLLFVSSIDSKRVFTKKGQYRICRFYFNKIYPDGDRIYWYASSVGLQKIDDNKSRIYQAKEIFQKVDGFIKESDTTFLLGCLNGLWRFNKNQNLYEFAGGDQPLLKERIVDLAYFKGKVLCIATKGAGLLLKKNNQVIQLNTLHGLSSNNLKKLLVEDTVIWACSDNGLNRILLDRQGQLKSIRVFSTCDGLVSNEIYKVVRFGCKLWVATDKGLSFFVPEEIINYRSPVSVSITSMWINEKRSPVQENYNLSYAENTIRLGYIAMDYKRAGKIRYRYRMEGLDTTWVYTGSREVQYTTLPSGQYKFVVEARDLAGNWNRCRASVGIEIQAPFWETWWFRLGAFVGVIVVIVLITKYILKRMQDKKSHEEEIHKALADLKLKALRAQMNPHFIFNVMTSIQHFIIKNDEEAAHRYLSKFSRLIRAILNNSEKNTISLSEELKALGLYLELENMRFERRFDYEITVDKSIDMNATGIPSMLIQPYVENAVKHGILESGGIGRIKVSIVRHRQVLKCTIEDNGVGRAYTSDRRSSDYRSFGTSITKERLSVINELYHHSLSEHVTDLYDENHKPIGTRVEIYIPYV